MDIQQNIQKVLSYESMKLKCTYGEDKTFSNLQFMKYAKSPKIVAISKRTCKFIVNSYMDKQINTKIL